jgi:hypothetical protein
LRGLIQKKYEWMNQKSDVLCLGWKFDRVPHGWTTD